jgi:hypothetical protein
VWLDDPEQIRHCPFGAPGDVLACRETWQYCWRCGRTDYAADVNRPRNCRSCDEVLGPWHSPVGMPTGAIRTRLALAGVECRRVNTITDNECELTGTRGIYEQVWNDLYAKLGPEFAFDRAWAWFGKAVKP